jgi:hypothetical protein
MTEAEAGRVECYSGHSYTGEPRALVWEGRRTVVVEVEARWRTPDGPAFRVHVESGDVFDLHYHELADRWTITSLPKRGQGGLNSA